VSQSNQYSFTIARVKTWDAVIVGGGIIGLSLARELHRNQFRVLVLDRGQPGHEASYAAAGMLADSGEIPPAMQQLATLSAQMYPEFVREIQDESGDNVDLRPEGAIVFFDPDDPAECDGEVLSHEQVVELEPELAISTREACFRNERSVDPRALTAALWKATKRREIDISSGAEVVEMLVTAGKVNGVRTAKTSYSAPIIVNCAGAWSGAIPPLHFPTRPVKGQMLCMIGKQVLQHVVRTPDVYLVPRSDGRVVIGSTFEEAGFDKRTAVDTIQRLQHAATSLMPALSEARIHESWAGLRPATPDALPIMGETEIQGYFLATGHFRDGILLAPATARVMAQLIVGRTPEIDIAAFSPLRYS
jgi:glycine oxidase